MGERNLKPFQSVLDLVGWTGEMVQGHPYKVEGLGNDKIRGSSGLTTQAALAMASDLDDPDAFVVTTLADWGERYLSKLYDDDWMKDNSFLERPRRRTVQDLVGTKSDHPALISIEPTTSVRMALSTLSSHGVSQLLLTRSNAACLVRENGDLSGIVTRYDIVRSIALGVAR